MKVFITGATGFLGQRVVKRIAQDGSEILGLARSERSAKKLESLSVTPVLGSLEDIERWQGALSGVDVVIHCAAPVEFWGAWQKYQTGIVDATKAIFEASEKQGVKRFIFISSESVLQDKKDLIDIDESEPYPSTQNSNYGKSKMLAEQYILAQSGNMASIILRPTFIWGRGVQALTDMVGKVKSSDFMWINNGQSLFEMVHVDNVAEAIALSCSRGESKSVYIVTDDNCQTVRSFLSKLLKTQDVHPSNKSIPKGLASILASLVEVVWKGFGLKSTPPLTKFDLAFVAMGRRYNIEKIKKDLGYKPVVSEKEGLDSLI